MERERERERERAGRERRRRERKEKDNAVPSSNRLIQNPLHMIQKYSTVWIIHPWLSALKPLDCVGPTHTITSHLQSRHSLPDSTLTQQITTINTQLLSMFPPFHLTKKKKKKPKRQHSLRKAVWKASPCLTHMAWQDPPWLLEKTQARAVDFITSESRPKRRRTGREQSNLELSLWHEDVKETQVAELQKKKKKKATPADFTRLWPHHALYYQTHHLPVCQCWW